MIFGKRLHCLLLVLFGLTSFPVYAQGQVTTLYQSVERALAFSPKLKALAYNNQAVLHDLQQARASYGPSVDLLLGYGVGQYSDSVTRQPGADPSDSDWNPQTNATLKLTQKVYDGGETRQTISIQKALLESANYGFNKAIQSIALDAVIAHLDVFRQRERVAIAKKDFQIHQDIFQAFSDIEQAGAGDISDLTQTQARLAQARSDLIINQGDLRSAIANYEQMVGATPGEMAFTELPEALPISLDDALARAEKKNPGLLAIDARLKEAEARVNLARSAYKPKFNIELSSRYRDHIDGDPSWQHDNDAMLVVRWNLFNGGQDKQAINAAISRKYQSRLNRDDNLIALRREMTTAWASFLSLRDRKDALHDAVSSSKKTFDVYTKQYGVSRRSLLDVLNAEREYFLSAIELVNASVDEIITAYRILSLSGELQVLESSGVEEGTSSLSRLSQAIALPGFVQSSASQETPIKGSPGRESGHGLNGTNQRLVAVKDTGAIPSIKTAASITMKIGPCTDKRILAQAVDKLQTFGCETRQISGVQSVKVTRLLEGRYFREAAYARLKMLKKSIDAFILREGDQFAIYVGSFQNHEIAIRYANRLAKKNISATPIGAEIEKRGTILILDAVDQSVTKAISKQMAALGLEIKTYSDSIPTGG
ncbi:hypothetical protein DSCO28_23710 [Desulfosarcina ovata subsp. sediminis]|uniref:SPOR domain-containing protein n=2 Tax=Desulfosarcina ovata TaxID=83564 RepID=A0A5K7ZMZ0_9BACT|nr:hypothetical protein DSCO28_23710 [Desulfosarcina ovata subsp. sediminis]